MKTIIHTLHIHAAPDRVYRALTTEEGVTGWWTNEATLEAGEGKLIRFSFHGDFHPHMKQTVLEEPSRVSWVCVAGHENWTDNVFDFHLRPREGETSLRFVQEYAQELDDDTYGIYNFNWGFYLNSLKKLCENGVGTPFDAKG